VLANASNRLPTVNGWKKGAVTAKTQSNEQATSTSANSPSGAVGSSIGSGIPLPSPQQLQLWRPAAGSLEPSVLVASPAASPRSFSLANTSEGFNNTSLSQAAQDIDSMLADLAEDAVAMSAVEAYWEEQRNALNGSPATSSHLPHDVPVSVTKMTRLLEETDAWLSQSASLATGSLSVLTTVSHSSSQLSTGDDPEPELPQDCIAPQQSPSIRRRRLLSMRTSSVEQFFIHDTPTRTTSTTISHGAMTPTDVDVVLAPSPASSALASSSRCPLSSPISRSSSNSTEAGSEGRGHLERGLSSHDESWLDLVKANVAAADREPQEENAMAQQSEELGTVELAASNEMNATLQRQLQVVVEKLAAVDEIRVQAEQTVQQLQAMKSTGELGMQSLAALSLACVAFHVQQQQTTQDAIVERVSAELQNRMQQHLQANSGAAPNLAEVLQSPPAIVLVPDPDATETNGDEEETTPPVSTPNSPGSSDAEAALPPLSPVRVQALVHLLGLRRERS
jgi:hypothetical protein